MQNESMEVGTQKEKLLGRTAESDDDILDEPSAAEFLKLSRITLIRKRNGRKLEFYRIGTRILYSKTKHLLPFLDRHEQRIRK